MNRPLLAFAGLIVAGGTAAGVYVGSPGGSEEVVVQQVATSTPSASATAASTPPGSPPPSTDPSPVCATEVTDPEGTTLWRWGNATVLVAEGSGIQVGRSFALPQEVPPDGGMALHLISGDKEIVIDADDGRILRDRSDASMDPSMKAAMATICVSTNVDQGSLPWPYQEAQPETPKAQKQPGTLRYWEPDPAAGTTVGFGCEGPGGGGGCFLVLSNVRSTRAVYVDTGEIISSVDDIAPEDKEAFDRWTGALELPAP